ncbi:MAG TPA: hypothetical protein VEF05_07890, partial [Terriglobales bacterium]|nr:hypothetical protein [Terriglobales bacterium]
MFDTAAPKFVAVCLCAALWLFSGCGGAGPTPLGGTTPVGAVSISISPATTTLAPGATQAFSATVNNATNTAVGWLVNGIVGGNDAFGTIDKNGNYAAPLFVPTPAAVTITAVSEADSTQTANASAKISGTPVPVTITISPSAVPPNVLTVYTGQTFLFTASVTGAADPSVSWLLDGQPSASADPSLGTIAAVQTGQATSCTPAPGSQNEATFNAPAQVPTGKQVTITAVSNEYPSVTASTTVTIAKSPTATGVYITPTDSSIYEGQSEIFSALVVGLANSALSWKVSEGVGVIVPGCNNTAIYTAPASVSGPTNVLITVISQSNSSYFAQANITVSPPPANAVVTLSPASATAIFGQTIEFTATVTGASDTSIGSWLLNGEPSSGTSDNLGTLTPIDATHATYTAPQQVPGEAITITAVSNANPLKSASASVTVVPPSGKAVVTVSPNTATLWSASSPQVFSATVSGATNPAVSWQVDGVAGGNSTVGTVQAGPNNTATYTPPASIPASFQVSV